VSSITHLSYLKTVQLVFMVWFLLIQRDKKIFIVKEYSRMIFAFCCLGLRLHLIAWKELSKLKFIMSKIKIFWLIDIFILINYTQLNMQKLLFKLILICTKLNIRNTKKTSLKIREQISFLRIKIMITYLRNKLYIWISLILKHVKIVQDKNFPILGLNLLKHKDQMIYSKLDPLNCVKMRIIKVTQWKKSITLLLTQVKIKIKSLIIKWE